MINRTGSVPKTKIKTVDADAPPFSLLQDQSLKKARSRVLCDVCCVVLQLGKFPIKFKPMI